MINMKNDNAGSHRGRSGHLWRFVPNELAFIGGSYPGDYLSDWDDFIHIPTGKYTATQATAGVFEQGTSRGEGGWALAMAASSTLGQGINVQETPWIAPEVGCEMAFETRLIMKTYGTPGQFFVGLASTDTTIIAGAAITAASFIGFYCLGSNSVTFGMQKAGGGIIKNDAVHTFVDDEPVRLGFRVDPRGDVIPFVNGRAVDTAKFLAKDAGSYLPTATLGRSVVMQTGGTTQPDVNLDFWGVVKKKHYS